MTPETHLVDILPSSLSNHTDMAESEKNGQGNVVLPVAALNRCPLIQPFTELSPLLRSFNARNGGSKMTVNGSFSGDRIMPELPVSTCSNFPTRGWVSRKNGTRSGSPGHGTGKNRSLQKRSCKYAKHASLGHASVDGLHLGEIRLFPNIFPLVPAILF